MSPSRLALPALAATTAASALAVVTVSSSASSSAAAPSPMRPQAAPSPSPAAAGELPPVLARPVVRRASRGGARTALPPVRLVTRTVAAGPTLSGQASWYGGSFQGRTTADGERFDTEALTAASKTLPFGTRLRVCHAGRCVVVRVNDRGPYVGSRILDLSHAAARAIGYDGVAQVTATPVVTRTVAIRPRPARPVATPAPVVAEAAVAQPVVLPVRPSAAPQLATAADVSSPPALVAEGALLAAAGAIGLAGLRRRRSARAAA